jgi:dihydrofolate reductase
MKSPFSPSFVLFPIELRAHRFFSNSKRMKINLLFTCTLSGFRYFSPLKKCKKALDDSVKGSASISSEDDKTFFSSNLNSNLKADYNINMIVASCENYVIGKDGQLPWKIKEDWDYFKKLTTGGILILGRRCYEERGCAFPNLETIVVSTTLPHLPDAQVARSVEQAILMAKTKVKEMQNQSCPLSEKSEESEEPEKPEYSRKSVEAEEGETKKDKVNKTNQKQQRNPYQIWICGGSKVYLDGAKFCSKLYLTRIHSKIIKGDTYFPASILKHFPHLLSSKKGYSNEYDLTFYVYGKMQDSR